MRVLLAGATGAIGRPLLPMLLKDGHEVCACSRSAEGAEQIRKQGAQALQVDVFDREALLPAVARVQPDAVIHQLTALSAGNPLENARIRREGTRNLVDAALAAGARRLIAQSIAWIYEPGSEPATESTPLDLAAAEPRATTVRAVQALEAAAAEVPEHVVLRYGTFYGPGTWYAPGALMAERLRSGALPANDAVASFIHVRDAAVAALQALAWPSGTYHIVDDEPARARDWVPSFAAAVRLPAPPPSEGRAPWERGASNALARQLGWRPHYASWRAGFAALDTA
jgi:nucleoside-diphosphate-sugar epimerase